MEEKNAKNENVTRKDLENLLGEQTQTILSAMDARLDKRLGESESKLGKKIDDVRSELYIVRKELVEKIDGVESRLEKKINDVNTSIDGYVKAQEDFKQEFTIMQEEGKQMKNAFKDKLGLEIKAI